MVFHTNIEQSDTAWKEYVQNRTILDTVDTLVAKSWQRCFLRINPQQKVRLNRLNSNHLLAAQVAGFDLISIARPVMEDIHQYMEHSDIAFALVNSTGYILDILGNETVMEILAHLDITTGALISESQMGTNAFALAMIERVPVQVTGSEHFIQHFHQLMDAAAPVFDISGHPLGAIGLFTNARNHYPQSLSLVVAAARAIEAQRQADSLLADQNKQLAGLNAILSSISEGIIVWNSERVLVHINTAASQIIDIPAQAVMGKSIYDLITTPEFVKDALAHQEPLTNVDVTLGIGNNSVRCILSLNFVTSVTKELQWIIATLKPEKEVRQLIHYQFGIQAFSTMNDIIGESPQINSIRRIAKQAAPAFASILIRGEYGTGKNLVASAIHNESPRQEGPFIIFPCSSIPRELIISELVGYDIGVTSKRPGGQPSKFELAQAGTLFIQNVEALPLEAQAILLNVLDLGVVLRLGSDHPTPVDVRIIASSSANLEKLIEQGSFLADLYYRLSSFEINLPPLRQRVKDIPLLIDGILNDLSQQLNHSIEVDPAVIELLKKYSWPGNIRELENILSRAAVQADNHGTVTLAYLPDFILHPVEYPADGTNSVTISPFYEVQENVLRQAAAIHKGNITRMARALGIGRTTVWRKLKEYEISPDSYRNGTHLPE